LILFWVFVLLLRYRDATRFRCSIQYFFIKELEGQVCEFDLLLKVEVGHFGFVGSAGVEGDGHVPSIVRVDAQMGVAHARTADCTQDLPNSRSLTA